MEVPEVILIRLVRKSFSRISRPNVLAPTCFRAHMALPSIALAPKCLRSDVSRPNVVYRYRTYYTTA